MKKIKSGASLIQIYTSMIYRGPSVAKHINQEILTLLEKMDSLILLKLLVYIINKYCPDSIFESGQHLL